MPLWLQCNAIKFNFIFLSNIQNDKFRPFSSLQILLNAIYLINTSTILKLYIHCKFWATNWRKIMICVDWNRWWIVANIWFYIWQHRKMVLETQFCASWSGLKVIVQKSNTPSCQNKYFSYWIISVVYNCLR